MSHTTSKCRILCRAFALLGVLLCLSGRAAERGEEEVEAIWHVQSLPLEFSSGEVFYNCDALKKKIENLLAAVGAHPSMIIEASCSKSLGFVDPVERVKARIALATPVVANEENVRAATTFDERRKLLARMQNAPLPTATNIQRFMAVRRSIQLNEAPEVRFDAGDCEMLRALINQVFPKIDVHVEQTKFLCAQAPIIEVSALVPVLKMTD